MDGTIDQILLVEDEDAHSELMKRAFASHSDKYQLTIARSLKEARECLEKTLPRLVISDLLLPDGRGTELLSVYQSEKQFPLIVITSHGNEEVVVEAMKAGALDYVVKSEAVLADMPHIAQGALREWDNLLEKKHAEEQIHASLKEKELLLKEIHHRVKNNLQVISSLLRLQARHIHDEEALHFFKNSQNRVLSMALVHEKLYQSEDFAHINLGEYIRSLAQTLFRSHANNSARIDLNVDINGFFLGVDYAVPCALVINELLSNSIHHAFPDNFEGNRKVNISLQILDDEYVELIFNDNGVGFPDSFNFEDVESLGLHLVQILVSDQLYGDINLINKNGACFTIKFKNVFS